MTLLEQVGPGDVLITRSGGRFPRLIRLGAALRDQPNIGNHVLVLSHLDAAGRWQGLEGRPGGVGWTDCTDHLAHPWTVSNAAQRKTDDQRADVVGTMRDVLLGTPYDHVGIASDAVHALGLDKIWQAREWDGDAPPRVVCSSAADYTYERVGLANPGGNTLTRRTKPADWHAFIIEGGWKRP